MGENYSLQKAPFIVPTSDEKYIVEHFGKATDKNDQLSIAHLVRANLLKINNLANIP
jgi:ethanolamine utilization protein EutQ